MKLQKTGKSIRVFPSALQEAILLVLIPSGRKGLYGEDIMKKINNINRACSLKIIDMGSLYPAFKRMSDNDWIQGRWGDDNIREEESGGARRRYYYATNSAIIVLNELWKYRTKLQDNQVFPIPEIDV